MRVQKHPLSRLRALSAGAAFLAAASIAACGGERALAPEPAPELASTAPQGRLDALFESAGREFGVPASLLKAVGYTETRWEMVRGQVEFEGMPAAFGIMALRGDRLTRGAQLAGVAEADARGDARANIRAAAALLADYARDAGIDRTDLGAWAPVVARYSGIAKPEGQLSYVRDAVYAVLREGAVARDPVGALVASIQPAPVTPDLPAALRNVKPAMVASADYAPAIWRPSPNYNARPAGDIGKVGMIIIHTCEGSYSSCWSWLTNPDAGTSAHYVINESGSEISQLVLESNRAWHIGATYDCANNSGVECWRNGYSSNHFTVGIEHGGYASQSSFPAGQIDASAKLSCDISKAHGIPRDKYHVVAHGQLQPYNRTDPGANWPWSTYLSKINEYCGASTGLVIDSNNGSNDTSKGYIEVSANWTSSASTAGYYGSGYYHAATAAVSDPATFWFYLPAAATKTIDLWWTAGTNRAPSTPIVVWNAGGTKLATVNVNQQANGGKWNVVGTYNFTAGWNKVQVSRWTTSGYVVIADAVRVR